MKKIVIFGAGRYGRKFLGALISNYDVQIVAYIDNNEKEWGGKNNNWHTGFASGGSC